MNMNSSVPSINVDQCEIGQLLNSKHVNLLKDQLQLSELLLLLLLLLLVCYHS